MAIAAPLSHTEIPAEWLKYAVAIGVPEQAAKGEWASFRFYWTTGKGAGTVRSEKGWATTWQVWVRKEAGRGTFNGNSAANQELKPGAYRRMNLQPC